MNRQLAVILASIALAQPVCSQQPKRRDPKPGFNLFKVEQDIQLGKEAKAEIEKQMQVVRDPEINDFIQSIGTKLMAQPEAGKYPYTFQVVNDKSINAFALPGGPTFIHTGLIASADNEAQIAGVVAHEIAHVALRHGTNQASKANLIQLPAMLAGALAGRGMLGQLAQLGIGLGANSVLLKYSRTAESDADLVGARMMAGAGYNPIEMARFFEKLEGEAGSRGLQFFSDHPNPGNRMKAIEADIRYLPKKQYVTDTGRLGRVKSAVSKLPEPPKPKQVQAQAGGGPPPSIQPSGSTREYKGREFSVAYPENWVSHENQQAFGVTIAPREGLVATSNGNTAVGYGAIFESYTPPSGRVELQRDTEALVQQLMKSNSGMRVSGPARSATVDGRRALVTILSSPSPYEGQEIDVLVTVERSKDLFYVVFVAPEKEYPRLERMYNQMLQSLRLAN
jgi:hypothetical protein